MDICLYCTCMKQLSNCTSEEQLKKILKKNIEVITSECLCNREEVKKLISEHSLQNENSPRIVVAACAKSARGLMALQNIQHQLPDAVLNLADIREGCIWSFPQADAELMARKIVSSINASFESLEKNRFQCNEKIENFVKPFLEERNENEKATSAELSSAVISNEEVSDKGEKTQSIASIVFDKMKSIFHKKASVEESSAVATDKKAEVSVEDKEKHNFYADKKVLVVGAGPAGLSAAAVLCEQGIPVTLVDKRPTVGGLINRIETYHHQEENICDVFSRCEGKAEIYLKTDVTNIHREGLNFTASFRSPEANWDNIFSAVVLATGALPVLPGTKFNARNRKGIISQMELDTLLTSIEGGKKEKSLLPSRAVFVQCVNSRDSEHNYCSGICCPVAIKNALRWKKIDPDAEITILNNQIVMPGIALESIYRKAKEQGIRFIHINALSDITVEGETEISSVNVHTDTMERQFSTSCMVCSTPMIPTPAAIKFAEQLGLHTDSMRFICGHEPAHPLETHSEGVFICGAVRWPVLTAQAAEQGRAAAVLVCRYLKEGHMPMEELPEQGPAASIKEELCSGCGRCVQACPHSACILDTKGTCTVLNELCRRCGVCAAVCPSHAAVLYTSSPSFRTVLAGMQNTSHRGGVTNG